MPAYKNICPVCGSEQNIARQYRGTCIATCCKCHRQWSRVKTGGEMRVLWDEPTETPGTYNSNKELIKRKQEK